MAFKRTFTNYVTSTAATGDQTFVASYSDSFQQVTIPGLYVGVQIQGFAVAMRVDGLEFIRTDTTAFNHIPGFIPVDAPVAQNAQLLFVTNDQSGSGHEITPIVVEYEVQNFRAG
jgi:hypothetical protein